MEWMFATAVALAAYVWGRYEGAERYRKTLLAAIQAGRSPATRAIRAALTLSVEHDQ